MTKDQQKENLRQWLDYLEDVLGTIGPGKDNAENRISAALGLIRDKKRAIE